MSTLPKLSYFNVRGRCEHIRYLFVAGGVTYHDYRLKDGEWDTLKKDTPFGGLPILDVGSTRIGQSIAIGRYVAKQAKLYGSTPIEGAIIDSIVDSVTEIREAAATKVAFEKDEEEKKKKAEELLTKAKTVFNSLEKYLAENKYLVGSKISWADIHFMTVVELVQGIISNILEDHQKLKDLYERVRAHPKIAEYIRTRNDTKF